jgi:hypothetical protein
VEIRTVLAQFDQACTTRLLRRVPPILDESVIRTLPRSWGRCYYSGVVREALLFAIACACRCLTRSQATQIAAMQPTHPASALLRK